MASGPVARPNAVITAVHARRLAERLRGLIRGIRGGREGLGDGVRGQGSGVGGARLERNAGGFGGARPAGTDEPDVARPERAPRQSRVKIQTMASGSPAIASSYSVSDMPGKVASAAARVHVGSRHAPTVRPALRKTSSMSPGRWA